MPRPTWSDQYESWKREVKHLKSELKKTPATQKARKEYLTDRVKRAEYYVKYTRKKAEQVGEKKSKREYSVRFQQTNGRYRLMFQGGKTDEPFYTNMTLAEAKRDARIESDRGLVPAVFHKNKKVWSPPE